jgi:hypothetical protein
MIEQKPSIERVVIESSNQRLSHSYPCERTASIGSAPSAEFSDTKVLNVVTRSSAVTLGVLHQTSLAPDIVESILAGETYANISLRQCQKGLSVCWEEQRRALISTK